MARWHIVGTGEELNQSLEKPTASPTFSNSPNSCAQFHEDVPIHEKNQAHVEAEPAATRR